MVLKPLVKWSGGKTDELEKIIAHMPDTYDTYVEPFVGGGALFFHLEPEKSIINDIHPELISLYRQVQEGNGQRIYDTMKKHKNDEATYYQVRDKFEPADDFDKAFKFYYLRKHCYRGMMRYNASGKFNIPFGRYKTINCEEIKDVRYENLLKKTKIFDKDFDYIFQNFNSSDNFCFIDQPYDSTFTNYGYCEFGRKEQERLAKSFKETNMKCLMIIGETDYIRTLYDGYIVDSYPKKYKFKLHSGRVGDGINNNHLVIKNY